MVPKRWWPHRQVIKQDNLVKGRGRASGATLRRRLAPHTNDGAPPRGVRPIPGARHEDLGAGERIAPLCERAGHRAHRADGGTPEGGRARPVSARPPRTRMFFVGPLGSFSGGTATSRSRPPRRRPTPGTSDGMWTGRAAATPHAARRRPARGSARPAAPAARAGVRRAVLRSGQPTVARVQPRAERVQFTAGRVQSALR